MPAALGYMSATEVAATQIEEMIDSGALRPGSRIRMDELAAEFGMSRTPVREALERLQRRGLVQVFPRSGIYVREISAQEALDVYQLKESFEPLMARWAAERATPEERETFSRLSAGLTALVEQGDVATYVERVEQWRQLLLTMARSEVLTELFATMDSRIRRLRYLNVSRPERMRESSEQHQAIAAAIRSGDAELACELTQALVRSGINALRRTLADLRSADVPTSAIAEAAHAARSA